MAQTIPVFVKDPDEVLDYLFDFTQRMIADGNDALVSPATVTVEAGLTPAGQATSSTGVTVWLSGGTVGEVYNVECDVTTVGGRTYSRSIKIKVRNR